MHAVVVRTKIGPEAVDPEYHVLREQVVPAVQALPGFVSGHFLAAVNGSALAVVIFESEDAARAAADGMGVRPGGSVSPGTSMESVDFVEVAASV